MILCVSIDIGGKELASISVPLGGIERISELKTLFFDSLSLLGRPGVDVTSFKIYREKDQKLLAPDNLDELQTQLESIKNGTSPFTLSLQDDLHRLQKLEPPLGRDEVLVISSTVANNRGTFSFLYCACDSNRLPLSSA